MKHLSKKGPQKSFDTVGRRMFGSEHGETPSEMLTERRQLADIQEKTPQYYRYLYRIFKNGRLHLLYRRFDTLFRPFFWIYRIFRYTLIAITWIEASAVFLLFSLILLAFFPPILVLSAAFLYSGAAYDRRAARFLERRIGERAVLVSVFGRAPLVPTEGNDAVVLTVPDKEAKRTHARRLFLRPLIRTGESSYEIRESLLFRLRPFLQEKKNVCMVY